MLDLRPHCNIPPLERKQHLTRSEKHYARSGAVKDRSFPRAHSLTLKSQRKTNASTTPTHTTHLHPQPSCGCETEPSESLRAAGAGRDTQTRPGPEESWGGSQHQARLRGNALRLQAQPHIHAPTGPAAAPRPSLTCFSLSSISLLRADISSVGIIVPWGAGAALHRGTPLAQPASGRSPPRRHLGSGKGRCACAETQSAI